MFQYFHNILKNCKMLVTKKLLVAARGLGFRIFNLHRIIVYNSYYLPNNGNKLVIVNYLQQLIFGVSFFIL